MNRKHSGSSNHSLLKVALYLGGMGMVFAIWIVIGYGIAAWAVNSLGASPIWKGLGAIAGMIAGITNIILLVKRYLGDQQDG